MSLLQESARVESLTVLSRFRTGLYDCLPARRDALFELTDAVLSTDGPVRALVDLTLVAEHRRGHGALNLPAPERLAGTNGRPPKHRPAFALAKPATWPTPDQRTVTDPTRYGKVQASAWVRLHPRLTHRGPWLDHDGELPLLHGTLIHL